MNFRRAIRVVARSCERRAKVIDLELLQTLTQTFGPSGHEEAIRAAIRQVIEPYADEVRVDALGNLIAYRKGTGGGKRLLLTAHMDEIGVVVSHIEANGFARFAQIGGLRPLNCVGARVRFANGAQGVIDVEYREQGANEIPTLRQLYIDFGAKDAASVPVKVGDAGVFVGALYAQGERLISKTMDDRISCYVLVEVLRQLKTSPHDVYIVFTVQEEYTLAGARTAAYAVEPDMAIAVDVTGTGDTPKALPMAVELGKGPAVKVQDSGMIAHPMVREWLIAAARAAQVPYQLEILVGGTTDAAAMQLTRAGVPSGCLSIPCRHIHSPNEIVDAQDVEGAIQVLLTALTQG